MNDRAPAADARAVVRAYHQRTMHRSERYAAGPETLDWSAQPDPFRTYPGAPQSLLPLTADTLNLEWGALRSGALPAAAPFTRASLGALFELALGLAAWKEYGPDRWALRCNPSSGNLHPTEGYALTQCVDGIDDGVHHYVSRDHLLEQRGVPHGDPVAAPPRLWVALTSIHWREAWKYGERAFRYCQLDTGHAIGALAYAAACLGWRLAPVHTTSANLSTLLGLDRDGDFALAEREEPECLFEVLPADRAERHALPARLTTDLAWCGLANRLDAHPMYHWPVIDEVARATRTTAPESASSPETQGWPALDAECHTRTVDLIRQRRSGQHFDKSYVIDLSPLFKMLDAVLPRPGVAPWSAWDAPARVHPVLFVHRVAGLAPGIYVLPRSPGVRERMRAAMRAEFEWQAVEGCPAHLPLLRLASADTTKIARSMSCHQAIAADACFTLGMLAEFDAALDVSPANYRALFQEAGLLGQVLYLEAEAASIRGTGIGCFFDPLVHELLGLTDSTWQSMYHFTVGRPLVDTRIQTQPPYPEAVTQRT